MTAAVMKAAVAKASAVLALAVVAVVVLAGCAALPSANSGAEEGIISRPEQNSDLGGMELILYPVAVWGEAGASSPVIIKAGGREVYVRKRRGKWLARPRVKMGLFWNSRGDDVYLLVAVSGPPANIRAVEVHYDGGARELAGADNVRFHPGRNIWDGGDGKTPAAFAVSPEVFVDMLKSGESRVLVRTGGGVLELDLGALRRDSSTAMRHNAKVLFWQFYDKMMHMRKQQ